MDFVSAALKYEENGYAANEKSRWRVTLTDGRVLVGQIYTVSPGVHRLLDKDDRRLYFQPQHVVTLERQ